MGNHFGPGAQEVPCQKPGRRHSDFSVCVEGLRDGRRIGDTIESVPLRTLFFAIAEPASATPSESR
jgi:hypothetical protein